MSVGRNCKCVYMSRRSWFYVCMFFYIYTVKCMYICLNVFMYLCIYMFAIRSLSFNPRQENDKMLQHRRQKQLFDVLSMLF